MKTIFLVKPEEAELARSMERKLLSLPGESGILFAGVEVLPVTDLRLRPLFQVSVGCARNVEPTTAILLVKHTLRDLVEDEGQLVVEARRGVSRSSQAS